MAFSFFRRTGGRHDVPVSMAGLKLGDQFLLIGCGDGSLLAALAAKVGLTGRACAIDNARDRADRVRVAATKAGTLVEVEAAPPSMLPYDPGSFDLVVINDVLAAMNPNQRVGCLQETLRVLRPGGRCLVIEPAPRGGLGALLAKRTTDAYYASSGGAERALQAEGFKATRRLSEREGLAFVEGIKARTI
jgi:ubiquinone/menaquinone biosynthesis C-methylase UbiE